ncbi:MAG TPA: ankyrin repeat domain-containing protein [Spirochaetota bacterium]|nr:ankyrin repeat domain-containing protein [Spirochaetota bacterium]
MKRTIIAIIMMLVIALFAGCGSLSRSAYRGDLEGVKKHLEKGADINQYDRWGWTPIMWAIYYNYYDIVKYMLENKANPNLRSMNDYSSIAKDSTPLMIASYYGNTGIARLLLRFGADKNAENRQGETAFSIAEKYNFVEIMDLLGGKGANRYAIERKPVETPDKDDANQIILLNDGSRIVGAIISQTRTTVTVKTKYNTMTIEKSKISEMKYK